VGFRRLGLLGSAVLTMPIGRVEFTSVLLTLLVGRVEFTFEVFIWNDSHLNLILVLMADSIVVAKGFAIIMAI
jgi:hypothetical protein